MGELDNMLVNVIFYFVDVLYFVCTEFEIYSQI